MPISKAIYDLLNGNAPVAAVVSTRIEPGFQPQGKAKPYINWEIIGTRVEPDYDSFAGYEIIRVEIHSVATTYTAARSLSLLVRTAMSVLGPQTTGGVYIHRIFLDNETDIYEFNGGYEHCHTVSQDYSIHIKAQ